MTSFQNEYLQKWLVNKITSSQNEYLQNEYLQKWPVYKMNIYKNDKLKNDKLKRENQCQNLLLP